MMIIIIIIEDNDINYFGNIAKLESGRLMCSFFQKNKDINNLLILEIEEHHNLQCTKDLKELNLALLMSP